MIETSGARTPLRRAFLRAGTLVVAAATLVACGSSSTSSPSSSSSGGAGGSTAAGGTALSIGYDTDPASGGYDPILYSTGQRLFFESIYDSLFVQQADGSVVRAWSKPSPTQPTTRP